ncbi:extracellular solute-binding protein [Rhizobium sp.]|jgi:ABC-type uncharacterized transport system YnjBCD substrate-binding protein|uniref:extracellular solute-binding protein n=1 Tax=Rhizobium sp. TaxID=391 RepID=UPI000E903644|nr:ABC transporter substrate-binding protein [Rhizobium sp.]
MQRRIVLGLLASCVFAVTPSAYGQSALKNGSEALAKVNRDNFYDVVVPLAKAEGKVVMYNFAGGFGDLWHEGLIKSFEKKYGIKVEYSDVKGDQADQQLIAIQKTGQNAPVDAYFAGGGDYAVLSGGGVVANVNLGAILPNMATVPAEFKDTVFGVNVHGSYPIVHRNQTAIGYDSAAVDEKDVPKDFDELLAWVQKHPKKFAITLPAKGGSGGGFLQSAALNYTTGACHDRLMDYSKTQAENDDWAMSDPCLQPVWDYFTKLLANSELTNGNADTLNLINNKQAMMGTVWEDFVMTFVRTKQLPASFKMTLLKNGQVGSGDAFFIPTNAVHPAAAMLLINEAFSMDFQVYKMETKASRSPRSDFDASKVSDETRKYLLPASVYPALSLPANWIMTNALAKALDEKVLSRL